MGLTIRIKITILMVNYEVMYVALERFQRDHATVDRQ